MLRDFSKVDMEELEKKYQGKRIKLILMPGDPHPVPKDTEGTCEMIDGAGHLLMKWDNGSNLSLIPGVDLFEVIEPE
jgi:hypothetical protein